MIQLVTDKEFTGDCVNELQNSADNNEHLVNEILSQTPQEAMPIVVDGFLGVVSVQGIQSYTPYDTINY